MSTYILAVVAVVLGIVLALAGWAVLQLWGPIYKGIWGDK